MSWFKTLISNYKNEQAHKQELSKLRKEAIHKEQIEAVKFRLENAEATGKLLGQKIVDNKLNPPKVNGVVKDKSLSSKIQKMAKNANSMNKGMEGFMGGSFDENTTNNKGKKQSDFFTMDIGGKK